jgi:hypothetical protein
MEKGQIDYLFVINIYKINFDYFVVDQVYQISEQIQLRSLIIDFCKCCLVATAIILIAEFLIYIHNLKYI